jgi:prophage tail gpP-like protein
MVKPTEEATLIVNGQEFRDWETVWVQRRWADSSTLFRFTAAERDPIFTTYGSSINPADFPSWTKLQFKPGDLCTVKLAGQLAVTGFIETRQVAYNATQHGVQLDGKSYSANAAKSSVDSKTGSWDGKNILQIGQEVLAPYGVGLKVIGSLDLTPFKKLQNEKGELVWDFLERIARTRGVVMGSDHLGNLLMIGPHTSLIVDQLIEGYNIKSCQCVITIKDIHLDVNVVAQGSSDDSFNGPDATEMTADAPSNITKIAKMLFYTKLIVPMEHPPTSQAEVQARATYEQIWKDGTLINCTIVVQGWLRAGQALWEAGGHVWVNSPMAMLNQAMGIQNVTFTQDNQNGSQTTLDLVNPTALRGSPNIDVGGTQPEPVTGKAPGPV